MCKNKGRFIRRVGEIEVNYNGIEIPQMDKAEEEQTQVTRREFTQPSRRHATVRRAIEDIPEWEPELEPVIVRR